MARYKTILAWVLVVLVAGCSLTGEVSQANTPDAPKRVTDGNNQFALRLYEKLRGQTGNLFFSPYSISTALAMTYAGARGDTDRQMADALSFPTSADCEEPMTKDEFARVFGAIIKDLNARGGTDAFELRVANALWGQKDYEFLRAFTRQVEAEYGGKLQELDFVKATEAARQTINAWVEKQTNGKIKDLIERGVLNGMTRLVLTNAIYFKGNWASQFKEDRTQGAPFTLTNGSTVQTPMMNQKERFGYAETEQLQVLEMPYVGDDLSMVVLLPKETNGLDALEQELTAENLSQWLRRLRKREVDVSIPQFKMTSKFDLSRVLSSLGMPLPFSSGADFSGMTGRRDLFISAVIHQAYVDVNEEGTEAAAATAVTMKMTSLAPSQTPVFRADHPFIFTIRDTKSGSILFLGRVEDPTK